MKTSIEHTDMEENPMNTSASTFRDEGYLPQETLVEIVNKYRLRRDLCEDVDFLEHLGGKTQN